MAAVTQTNTLDRGLSVFDNLYFHGRYFGLSRPESRQRATELLAHFDLAEKAGARVDQLSGGLAQRVLIARALLHTPSGLGIRSCNRRRRRNRARHLVPVAAARRSSGGP